MTIKPSLNISWQIYDEKVYIMDERDETMIMLQDESFRFWMAMLDLKKTDLIVKYLQFVFDADKKVIEDKCMEFINSLVEMNIIEDKS